MKISALMVQLSTMVQEHGDIEVILQCDQEGNRYDTIRGADYTLVSRDFECTFDSQTEADECDEPDAQPVIVVYP